MRSSHPNKVRPGKKKLVSIVTPALNEEENIPPYYQALTKQIEKSSRLYDFEVIMVNDGSTDNTLIEMKKIVSRDKRFHYIDLSRNFGKEIATTAGINRCSGDACIIIDADLQFPLKLLPHFFEKWSRGYEVVVGVRKRNDKELFLAKLGSKLYYRIMDRIADTKITPQATDFTLIDRIVIDAFNRFTERSRITRGLVEWMGFRRCTIPFIADERVHGRPSYNFVKKFRLAMSSFVGLSLFPLKIAGYLGLLITTLSGLFGLITIIGRYFIHSPLFLSFSGTAMLAIITVFLVGIILASLGLIALYISSIYGEVMNRPLYIIRKYE